MLVGICGPSNSGKSSICEFLSRKYNGECVEVDHYLKGVESIPFYGKYRNWELPNDHDFEALFNDLTRLCSGKTINHPIYGFKDGRIREYRKVKSKALIFIEGFYLFYNKRIRDLLDVKIYLDMPMKMLLQRRVCTEEQWDWTKRAYVNDVVIPMYRKYGTMQKRHADFIVDATLPLAEVKAKVEKVLKKSIALRSVRTSSISKQFK